MDWPEINYDEAYLHEEDPDMFSEKRANRLYNFGVGKREEDSSWNQGKRSKSYDFGLGKRSVDALKAIQSDMLGNKRIKTYDFGLGKRTNLDNKRLTDKNYNFGLGKRTIEGLDDDEEALLML